MQEAKRFLSVILALCCLLSAFSACGKTPISSQYTPSTSSPSVQAENHTPLFMDITAGKLAVKDLMYGSEGWRLWYRPNYLYAAFGSFIVRYDIAKNQIDRIVNLGERQGGHYFGVSFSADGHYGIVFYGAFPGQIEDSRDYYMIDFVEERYTLISAFYDPNQVDQLPDKVKSTVVNLRFDVPEMESLAFASRQLSAFHDFRLGEGGTTEVYDIGDDRLGALMPADSAPVTEIALGYYKFAVVDANTGEIVQECAMNTKQGQN